MSSISLDFDTLQVVATNVQMSGLLMKKSLGKKTSKHAQKWQRRFFIAKDGFLLYYAESEKRAFESQHHFNIHPKGVIPLGGCQVTKTIEGSQKFAIRISHPHFLGEIIVAAENEEKHICWLQALTDSGKVTWKNTQLGESLVEQLELKSQQAAQEKQAAIDKLNAYASILEQEKEQKEELERLASHLEQDKKYIQEVLYCHRRANEIAEQDLKATTFVMNQIKEENSKLHEKALTLQTDLKDICRKSKDAATKLEKKERLVKQLVEEKTTLEAAFARFFRDLVTPEEQSKALEQTKLTIEVELHKEAEAAKKLKEKVRIITDTALALQTDLKRVEQVKLWSLSELDKERTRRIKTERGLLLAEESLKRLERTTKESGVHIALQVENDVKILREFFDDCKVQPEAHKATVMRDAVGAKEEYESNAKSDDVGTKAEYESNAKSDEDGHQPEARDAK